MRPLLFASLLIAFPALAQTPMTGAEFDAYTVGKTLTYGTSGEPYGIEEYLPNRRVVWAFVGDECRFGTWYEAEGQICFVYSYEPLDPKCWVFFLGPEGLTGQSSTDDGFFSSLVEIEQSPAPLPCAGPEVGV